MIVTVFRSRLKPGLREDYVALANRMKELAKTIPSYISHKDFYANDGERVLTERIYPPPGSDGIELYSHGTGGRIVSLTIWELNSIWK